MNKILLRLAADNNTDKNDNNSDNDKSIDDNTNTDTDIDINTDNDSDLNLNFELNKDDKSDIEKMVTDDNFSDFSTDSYNDPYSNFNPFEESKPKNNIQTQLIKNVFLNLANEGRNLLKWAEDFKFKIIQSINILKGRDELKTKIEQKQKILEATAAQIYGIVFDLENFDLTPNYENEQLAGETLPEQDNEFSEEAFNDDISNIDEEASADLDEQDKDEDKPESDLDFNDTVEPNGEEPMMQGGFDEIPNEGGEK